MSALSSTTSPHKSTGPSLDERDPNMSIPAQLSTTLRPQSIDSTSGGDEGYPPGISKAPQGLNSLMDRDMEASRTSVSSTLATVNHLPFPTAASTVPIEPCSAVRRDGDMGDEEVPAISLFDGSSNFQISNTSINAIGGNATIIRFGDGKFTEIQRNLICDYIANLTVLPDIKDNLKKHVLTQSIISLPRAKAVFNDYQNKKKSGPCFKGTREALLREMADWATSSSESRMYILSGLAGIGKSTVAYTIASRAADLNLLGASFFFSRDEADRKNAEIFFTTIAYQLCVYNETFSKAIGDVLLTERGSAATTKDPRDQLQALILEPLQNIAQSHPRPILIVVDALDECDEEDAFSVLSGLGQLVRDLPSFKIILTTRPQPYLDRFLCNQGHKIFRLQDIEDRVVDGDIRLYLNHSLSLKSVQERYPHRRWCASGEEIDSLVRAAGRLFIIASTAVRYTFDKSASNPAVQMQKLLNAFAQAYTPFKDLDHFYSVILRNVVPENCDDHIFSRYQSVVGAIIFVQRPLPVSSLAFLINIDVVEIREVLDNLQSVILLGSDNVPRIYHKSFPDYLTDLARCKDPRLRIDTKLGHTQITIRCFEIMDKYLKRNILGLSEPARFMTNEDGLKEDGITDQQLQEKIPQQLRYTCIYWANHLEVANIEDKTLMTGLERFADEHILYWLEVLSLIEQLASAHSAISVVLRLPKSTSSNLHQLLPDTLRFIGKFYEPIKRSALHTYYSALPFTPSDSFLYRRYIKDAVDNIFTIEGGPEKWDALVANMSQGEPVDIIKFSLASALFVSCSQSKSKIWDAATGTPISTIIGHRFAVANDFSTIASSEDKTITFYDMNGSARGTTLTTSSKIENLALSSESSRLAAALSDGTVWLWDSRNGEVIDRFDGFDHSGQVQFSTSGARLAYSSVNSIQLRDGTSGKFIADLQCASSHKFEFSADGCRIASVSPHHNVSLWNSESGGLIAAVPVTNFDSRYGLAISTDGSLLATADNDKVKLWSESRNHLAQIQDPNLHLDFPQSMIFSSDNTLVITTVFGIKLYNVKTHSFIHTFRRGGLPIALDFSPDCTRLAVGDYNGNVNLWDIRSIDPSSPSSKGNAIAVSALALSRDCSRLACGFEDGTVELWGTSPTKRRIGLLALRLKMEAMLSRIFRQSRHTRSVRVLGFDPDGRLFASGSDDGTIKLWNGGDGALRGTLKAPSRLQEVALSNSLLVATWDGSVTIWNIDTLSPIHTFNKVSKVSISDNSTILALCFKYSRVALFDMVNPTIIDTISIPYRSKIHAMTFLPDNSQLVVKSDDGAFLSLNLVNEPIIKEPTPLKHLIQLPNTPLWHGVPIWHCQDMEQHYVAALFSQHKSPVSVIWIPREIPVTAWAQGSSMIAVGCRDGRVILLRLPTS